MTLSSDKTRDDPFSPVKVLWDFERNSDGALDKGRFWHIEDIQPIAVSSYAPIAEKIPELLKGMEEPPSQNKLCIALDNQYDIKKPQAIKAINWAVEMELIEEIKKGTGKTSPKLYKAK